MDSDLGRLATVIRETPEEADELLDNLWETATPERQRVILLELAVDRARCIPSVDRAFLWSKRFRTGGLAHACPLVSMAADVRRLPSQRILAAATAHAGFQDPQIFRPLHDAAEDLVGHTQRALTRQAVERLDPELVPQLDAIWAAHSEPAIPINGNWTYKASIIIPLFNQVVFTARCLRYLAEVTSPDDYEIVLVDNSSTDDTPRLCESQTGNVQVIRNEENLGFAHACNQGAARAKGEVLIFLNNDTEARHGWLHALLNVLELLPDAGIVGAKLVFPDGTIQHAGANLVQFEDPVRDCPFAIFHTAIGLPADHPVANVRREVRIVTGAAMAVRREAFEASGGFDEEYWNGGEDVELCLTARSAGWRVIYEPDSCLVHHEGASGGERWRKQPENMDRLANRWLGRVTPDVIVHTDGSQEYPQFDRKP